MDYITSKNFHLPQKETEMEGGVFYNLWRNRLWPYRELLTGDTLYFYESPIQSVVWKTTVSDVERFPYLSKSEVNQRLSSWNANYSDVDSSEPYFVNAASQGFCLAYKIENTKRIKALKPDGFLFPRQGWLRVDAKIAQNWLNEPLMEEDTVLDDLVPPANLSVQLRHLSDKLADVTPERIKSLVAHTLRRDTQIVQALKQAYDWRCQYPGCGVRIQKKSGGYYVEVAHINPVSQGGHSVLGNLLVLCPNHHKSFDYGDLRIMDHSFSSVRGVLNGEDFTICCEIVQKTV